MRVLYIHILYIYVGVRIIYCIAVYDTYSDVYVRICTYTPFYEQYIAVTDAVYACISSLYLHIPMSVYVSICLYICQKYMHIHQSVYVRISRSRCRHAALGHGAVTVASHSPAPARGRCTFAARSLRQVCRAAAHGTSQNSIRSGLRDRTAAASGNLYRRALKCHCALKCHGNLGWRSFTR